MDSTSDTLPNGDFGIINKIVLFHCKYKNLQIILRKRKHVQLKDHIKELTISLGY